MNFLLSMSNTVEGFQKLRYTKDIEKSTLGLLDKPIISEYLGIVQCVPVCLSTAAYHFTQSK